MLKKISHFLKYNNATLLILVIIFIIGSGAWAQTDTGQEFIGEKQVHIENIDNSLLLELDLNNFDMDFKIENIESDPSASSGRAYYYITYTYLDLVKGENAWEYLLSEKIRKVSKSLKKDLGLYLGEELKEEQDARIALLQEAQVKAREEGLQTRTQVEEYSGLIGKTLELGKKVFKNYEAVKVKKLPSPTIPPTVLALREDNEEDEGSSDNLTLIYEEALERLDVDNDGYFKLEDNCPDIYNPDQIDENNNGVGDLCENLIDSELDDEILSDDGKILDDDEEALNDESSDAEATDDRDDEEIVAEDDELATDDNDDELVNEEDPIIEEGTEDEPEIKVEPAPEPAPEPEPELEELDVEIIELPDN